MLRRGGERRQTTEHPSGSSCGIFILRVGKKKDDVVLRGGEGRNDDDPWGGTKKKRNKSGFLMKE